MLACILSWIVSFVRLLGAHCCDDRDVIHGLAVPLVAKTVSIEYEPWGNIELQLEKLDQIIENKYMIKLERLLVKLLALYPAAGCVLVKSVNLLLPWIWWESAFNASKEEKQRDAQQRG